MFFLGAFGRLRSGLTIGNIIRNCAVYNHQRNRFC